jgi:predicted  nucleic acid-binding Zn-ribbon protein
MSSTTPNAHVSVLRILHRIHRQLTDLRERLARGPKQIQAAETNAQNCENALLQAKAAAKAMRMASDQKQLQLKSGEDKVKDLRRKLNAIASNREYQILLEQIAADEMTNSILADEVLEALEKIDAFQKDVVDAESVLAAAKQRTEEVRVEVAKHEPSLNGEIARLEAELKKEEAALSAEIAEIYRRIVRQKGEDALAAVENQCCSGCNQQVTLNVYSHIMMGTPMLCKSCGRLLYVPE